MTVRRRTVTLGLATALFGACTAPPAAAPVASLAPVASSPPPTPSATASVAASASAIPPPPASASAPTPPSLPSREVRAPKECVGKDLSFVRLKEICACEISTRKSMGPRSATICDYDPELDRRDAEALRVSMKMEPEEVPRGKTARLVVSYTNEGTTPRRVLLEREQMFPVFPALLDAREKVLAPEHDRGCVEVGILGMAQFALVVVEPGGRFTSEVLVHANRERRVSAGDMGCRSVAGTALPAGTYLLRWSNPEVWDLRDAKLQTTLVVR
jgi:hypothetical protein